MTNELYEKLRDIIIGLPEEALDKLIAFELQLLDENERKAVAK